MGKRAMNASKWLIVTGLLMLGGQGWAEDVPKMVADRILNNLKQGRPDLNYSEPRTTPIDGLYEVRVIGGPTLYVTSDSKFFIAGDLFGIQNGQFVDVQEKARAKERAVVMAAIDKSEQILFSPQGETKAFINVFTDVSCGYCQKLHREVPQLNAMGIEVRYLAYPRAGIDSEHAMQMATAWCADNPQDTLTKLKMGERVPIDVCSNNPVAKQYLLGNQMGVKGTPAIVLADGTMLPGYLPADELAKVLGVK